MWYLVECGHCALKSAGINRGKPQKLGITGVPKKQASSHYVSPHQIWSLCIKGLYIQVEGNPKMGSAGAQTPYRGGVADPKEHAPPRRVTWPNVVVLCERLWT